MNLLSRLLLASLFGGLVAACAPEQGDDTASRSPSAAAPPAPVAPADPDQLAALRGKLAKTLPDIKPENVTASVVPGIYQIQHGADFAYVTADGQFLIQGDMVNIETGEEVTEAQRKALRVAKLDELGEDNMIIFAPEKPVERKYVVTVFTDVDCGYCRRLHSEIAQYNQQGIEIRYVFYPRTGPQSPSFAKAEQVWCAADRKAALTQAKLGAPVAGKVDCPNPVMREWELGGELGLRGTPMLVLGDGEVVNGYVPPAELAQRLAARQAGAAPDKIEGPTG